MRAVNHSLPGEAGEHPRNSRFGSRPSLIVSPIAAWRKWPPCSRTAPSSTASSSSSGVNSAAAREGPPTCGDQPPQRRGHRLQHLVLVVHPVGQEGEQFVPRPLRAQRRGDDGEVARRLDAGRDVVPPQFVEGAEGRLLVDGDVDVHFVLALPACLVGGHEVGGRGRRRGDLRAEGPDDGARVGHVGQAGRGRGAHDDCAACCSCEGLRAVGNRPMTTRNWEPETDDHRGAAGI